MSIPVDILINSVKKILLKKKKLASDLYSNALPLARTERCGWKKKDMLQAIRYFLYKRFGPHLG